MGRIRGGKVEGSLLLHHLSLEAKGLEEEAYSRGFRCIAGLDEVGRGTWAGPVVAAAVVLPPGISNPGIKDSKLLTPRKRETLAPWIKEKAVTWGLGVVGSEEIDRMNILNASLLAMAHAFLQLKPVPDYLLIDGPHKIPLDFLKTEGGKQQKTSVNLDPHVFSLTAHALPFQRAIKKGDGLCLSIAAASIVAKAARDQMMVEYDRTYPEYGFGRHKGYGSPLHLATLSRYGPSPIHRRSFKPVRQYLADVDEVGPASLFRQG